MNVETKSKLTAKAHGHKISVEMPWDASISDWFDAFRTVLTSVSFERETIDDQFLTEAERINERLKETNDTPSGIN